MADFGKTYNAVLADFRAHGQPVTNFVPFEELERGDQAFLRGLMAFCFEQGEQALREKLCEAMGVPVGRACPLMDGADG